MFPKNNETNDDTVTISKAYSLSSTSPSNSESWYKFSIQVAIFFSFNFFVHITFKIKLQTGSSILSWFKENHVLFYTVRNFDGIIIQLTLCNRTLDRNCCIKNLGILWCQFDFFDYDLTLYWSFSYNVHHVK